MKKKIAFFNLNMQIGGVERQLYYLLKALNHDDFDCRLFLCRAKGEFLDQVDKRVKIVDLSIDYSRPKKLLIAIKLFIALLKEKPDALVSFHAKLNSVSVLACGLLRIKVVSCFAGVISKGKLNYIRRLYLRRSNAIIAVSNGVKTSILKHIGRNFYNIEVIDNAVDIDDVLSKSTEEADIPGSENKFVIVSAGRTSKDKNFALLIKTAPLLPENFEILIIGDGDNKRNLETMSKRLGCEDKIRFLGFQLNPYKFVKRASVYVLSNSDSEGLPTVLLEAMLLGIPCVCSDYYGRTDDVISHEKTGYILGKENELELARALEFVSSGRNSDLIRNMVSEAHAKALRHNLSNYAAKYEALIKKVLEI